MIFALGIAAFGAARILSGRTWNGILVAGLGLWLAGLVRFHVAGIFALALATAYILRKPPERHRRRSLVAKGVSLAAVGVFTVIVVLQAEGPLQSAGIGTEGGFTSVLQQVSERTGQGGSEIQPSIIRSPLRAPIGVFTVLFRPLPIEADSTQALIAALEGTFLLALCIRRYRWILAAFHSFRRQAYLTLSVAYTAAFVLVFSAIANLGILARQRVQMLPFFLVLLSVPPRRRRGAREGDEARGSLRPSSLQGAETGPRTPAVAGPATIGSVENPAFGSQEDSYGRGG
jgi:hypothetical protein